MAEYKLIEIESAEDVPTPMWRLEYGSKQLGILRCSKGIADWLDENLNRLERWEAARRRGAGAKSEKKAAASRENGKKGGRKSEPEKVG